MNFIMYLGAKYFTEEKWYALALFAVSLASSILQTNGIATLSSQLMTSVQSNQEKTSYRYFWFYAGACLVFVLLYYLWYYFNNELLTKIRPWVRTEIVSLLLSTNNQKFSETNFSKLNSPINRIVDMYYFISYTIISELLPTFIYLVVSSVYFTYINPFYGLIFFVGNVCLTSYWLYHLQNIIDSNDEYEKKISETDIHLIDLLNNVDKVIYRGQTNEEIRDFAALGNQNFNLAKRYYSLTNGHLTVMTIIIFSVVLASLFHLIRLVFQKKIDPTLFIASFTILMLYREKVSCIIELLPNLVDFIGRTENVLHHFKHVNDHYDSIESNEYDPVDLDFKEIQFINVTYRYGDNPSVFENRNYYLRTSEQNIIGITGRSGNGKSTFIKLLLRMYECNAGKITIDGVDISQLDPNYIRREITYVNQTSKLFDRKVVDNMLYGCSNREVCDFFLEKIMQYPNITKLYQNTDIHNKQAGLLGENLSGGQRQIVNMIGGLINPSKILVLDEPTNALDPELKSEILSLIKDFRRYKQAIIIITHDKDVFPLFNQQIHM